MKAWPAVAWSGLVLVLGIALGAALVFLPAWLAKTSEPARPVETAAPPATRHIKATLYYVSDDGARLVAREREVPFGESVVDQARQVVAAQLQPPAPPLVSAIPPGTTLRALYVSEDGKAYVDLSREVSSSHPGGALNELLTVYSLVDVLTTNLPAVTAVQILVDGHEVDTLAGHVDLRRPLPASTVWIAQPGQANLAGAPSTTAGPAPAASAGRTVPATVPAAAEPAKR